MDAGARPIGLLRRERRKRLQVFPARGGEPFEKFIGGVALAQDGMAGTVERGKAPIVGRRIVGQYDPGAWDPVRLFAEEQMADDFVRAPGTGPLRRSGSRRTGDRAARRQAAAVCARARREFPGAGS